MQTQIIESVLDDTDDAGFMAKSNLYKAIKDGIQLHKLISDTDPLEPWIAEKISLASDYLETVKDYVEYRNVHNNEFSLNGMRTHSHHEYEESAISEAEQQDPNAQQDPTQNQPAVAATPAPAPQAGALATEPAVPAEVAPDLGKILDGIKRIQKYAKSRGDLDPEFDKDKLVKLISKKIEGTSPDDAEKIAKFIFDGVTESTTVRVAEGVMKDIHFELSQIAEDEDYNALYELMSANSPAGKYVQNMAEDITIDKRLHPDDDFEEIQEVLMDRIVEEFGGEDVAEGNGAHMFAMGEIVYHDNKKGKVDRQEGNKVFVHVGHGDMDVWPADETSLVRQGAIPTMKKHIGQMGRGLKGFVTGRPELEEQNVMDEWAQYKLSTTRSTSNESVEQEVQMRMSKMFGKK